MTGAPVILGVEFVGGTELRVTPDTQENAFQDLNSNVFSEQPNSVQSIPADGSYIITFRGDSMDVADATEQAESAGYTVQSSSTISASFGSGSQELALYGLLFAFLGMSVVVFGLFRSFIPSITVVASAFNVLVLPLAMMNLSGIELSFGTITALLMLLGYSVDSDMLLNDYVVKRGGEFYDAVYTAMDTGITMTLTSILAMAVMAIISSFAGIPLLRDIGVIIVFGLIIDIMNTYMMNVTILRWYRFNKGGST
jgi:preprotein translocase subunit SecF